MEDQATADRPTNEPPGAQVLLVCPECNGPMASPRTLNVLLGIAFHRRVLANSTGKRLNARSGLLFAD
jgi:hypothetical protein